MTQTNPVAAEGASGPDLIEPAAEVIARFFPEYRRQKRQIAARELNAEERQAVIIAGDDAKNARQVIKHVFARAYDRRREASATAAAAELEKDRQQNEQVRQELAANEAPPAAESAPPAEAVPPPQATPSDEATPPADAVAAPEAAAVSEAVPGGTVAATAPVETPQA